MPRQVRRYPKDEKVPDVPKGHKGPDHVSPPSSDSARNRWFRSVSEPGREVFPPSGRSYSPFPQDSDLGLGPPGTDSYWFGVKHGTRHVYTDPNPNSAFPIEVHISVWNDPFGTKLWCIHVPDLGFYGFFPYWDAEGNVTRPTRK